MTLVMLESNGVRVANGFSVAVFYRRASREEPAFAVSDPADRFT
jgi:hypothetical protein